MRLTSTTLVTTARTHLRTAFALAPFSHRRDLRQGWYRSSAATFEQVLSPPSECASTSMTRAQGAIRASNEWSQSNSFLRRSLPIRSQRTLRLRGPRDLEGSRVRTLYDVFCSEGWRVRRA